MGWAQGWVDVGQITDRAGYVWTLSECPECAATVVSAESMRRH